jgi:multidrug efflux pump subunit AcrB
LRLTPIADQSIFVRAAIRGMVREAIIAACLTAAMILIFLGSWRSTLIIAVSNPLSIICSLLVLVGNALEQDHDLAEHMMEQISHIPGTTDLRIQQPFNLLNWTINVDRTRAQQVGCSQHDAASDVLTSLSGSFQTRRCFI